MGFGEGGFAGRRAVVPATRLLGGDEVAVVRLTAVDDLDLRSGRCRADLPGDVLGLAERRVDAVVERDQLIAPA